MTPKWQSALDQYLNIIQNMTDDELSEMPKQFRDLAVPLAYAYTVFLLKEVENLSNEYEEEIRPK